MIDTTEGDAFQNLHGQDTAKRAMEIALVGMHDIELVPLARDPAALAWTAYGIERMPAKSRQLAEWWAGQFPNDNAQGIDAAGKMAAYCVSAFHDLGQAVGTVTREHYAGSHIHAGYNGPDGRPAFRRAAMVVEVLPLSLADLVLPPPAEGIAPVAARILAARERLPAVGYLSHNAAQLLEKWGQHVVSTADDEADVVNVAWSIHALSSDPDSSISRMALAEAMSYRSRPAGDLPACLGSTWPASTA
jgi:hypothetical protein